MSTAGKKLTEILEIANRLSDSQKIQLIQKLSQGISKKKKVKWMDLAGTGKELWSRVKARQYVREERESWD
jgi:hypothetical protein